MPPTSDASRILRISVGGLGIVFLAVAAFGAAALYARGWRWWLAILTLVSLVEAIDFLAAAFRRRGGWPTGANALLDLLLP